MTPTEDFVWKVAGAAGEGIMTTGLLFSKTCARHGWYIFDYTEYPSLIRGGHNTYQVAAGKNPIYSQKEKVDLLIALNQDGIEQHQEEVGENSLLVFDQEHQKIEIEKYNLAAKLIDLPMVRLAKEAGGEELMANNVALGASVYLLGLDLDVLIRSLLMFLPTKVKKSLLSINKPPAPVIILSKSKHNHNYQLVNSHQTI